MNKNYVFAGVGVVGIVVAIIVLVMMNAHPSLAEIVENKDCQELGKFDQRMDEIYGYDVKKAKTELNISEELFSKARSLGIDCAFDAVKSMHDGDSSEDISNEDLFRNGGEDYISCGIYTSCELEIVGEAAEIIKDRDCKRFIEWYENNTRFIYDMHFAYKNELDSYHDYCEEPNTVLDENGIDVEEQWSTSKDHITRKFVGTGYSDWDHKYRTNYLSEIKETLKNSKSDSELMHEYIEIIKDRDCKRFIEWYDENIDHVDVLDSYDDWFDIVDHSSECEIQNLVEELKESNPSDLDPTKAVDMLYWVLKDEKCKKYDQWIRIYGEDFGYVKDKLAEEYSSEYNRCKFF